VKTSSETETLQPAQKELHGSCWEKHAAGVIGAALELRHSPKHRKKREIFALTGSPMGCHRQV
jgi:hypothetical protein